MPHGRSWAVRAKGHPGSSADEVADEPEWNSGHHHRIGFRNPEDRHPGITNEQDEYNHEIEQALKEMKDLEDRASKGELVNFRDIIQRQRDFHLRHPQNRSLGWRYVLDFSEDWVKHAQDWPINIRNRESQAQSEDNGERHDKLHDAPGSQSLDVSQKGQDSCSETAKNDDQSESEESSCNQQERALLRDLQQERAYFSALTCNDGKQKSPQAQNRKHISIDEQDQFTPDNWLPRAPDLVRLTGKHPLNAEAPLSELFTAGLITPNELHYVRNHGPVPRLLWEFHKLEIEYDGSTVVLTMDDIKHKYDAISIPVTLACDGNRRGELNMVKKSKGFGWGAGGVSCAYWRGPRLRDILLAAGVPEVLPSDQSTDTKRHWVNFEGADELSEGKYATCIPFEYAMDATNDVMLAYDMNDVSLPPDHGYPIRLMIPGYVGGRCVKWLRRIWISDKENDSHYHIWDNRVLPSFVTDMESELAEALFRHPDTACNEQILNSVIARPAQGERIPFSAARPGGTYRLEGYAYDGGGREIQRVEVSLDGGDTWRYCIRRYPDRPIRHGYKFWTWLHWHVDIDMMALLQATSITVRAFNSSKQTQPEKPLWNIMGMMNNCWYVVRPELVKDESLGCFAALFRHPTEQGTGSEGWMKPSVENEMERVKREASTPHKEFTRQEIEKHNRDDDCWIVVDGKVYDATSVLGWHPGGKAAIMNHAGKVHQETSHEFASIHDDFAYNKLNECVLGVVTQKARRLVQEEAKEKDNKLKVAGAAGCQHLALQEHRWVPVTLVSRHEVSEDTRTYTFRLPDGKNTLGIGTCQHVQVGFHMKDKMLIRSYTPTRPLLPPSDTRSAKHENVEIVSASLRDGNGEFDLTVKTYFPDNNQPGGALSNILDCIPIGEEVEIKGPVGGIIYNGFGNFVIEGKRQHFERVSLVLGGSGITPGYALIAKIALTKGDNTQVRVIDANKSERDILLKGELERFERQTNGQIRVSHILSHPSEGWKGRKGHVDAEAIQQLLFEPSQRAVAFLCGPPTMIKKVVLPALRDWGYVEDKNLFGF